MKKILFTIVISSIILGCVTKTKEDVSESALLKLVDQAHLKVEKSSIKYREIVQLDHHRMAKNDSAYTPPAIVSLFTDDSEIVSELIAKNQLIGIDMPFKILAYSEPKAVKASYAYTSAEFIKKRHDLVSADVEAYKNVIDAVVAELPQDLVSRTDVSRVDEGFGIIKLKSDFDYFETVSKVREFVRTNEQTLWFSQIDLQKDAKRFKIDIRPTMLCLYGVPAGGAKAMNTAPKIGLDAFCQKVLVYTDSDSAVYVALNDATSFGELYYGKSNLGQKQVAIAMEASLSKAITNFKNEYVDRIME